MELQVAPRDALSLDDLRTVQAFSKENPEVLTEASLRWHLRHRHTNGLAPACVRIGKKLLISRTRYEAWLATRAGAV